MSTIKSSDEHLTLNADGSSKDIKFQANGVEKASISSSGAFTSTTIDATKLTGALPAISGAALTGVGVAGITSTADATAITIDSAENVGFGVTPSAFHNSYTGLNVGKTGTLLAHTSDDDGIYIGSNSYYSTAGNYKYIMDGKAAEIKMDADAAHFKFRTAASGTAGNAITWTDRLEITDDGRGLSQFTAKAWVRVDMSTMGAPDSHNISSITDVATGHARCNFSNAMANSSYNISTSARDGYIAGHSNINTTSFYLRAGDSNWSQADPDYCMALVFGD